MRHLSATTKQQIMLQYTTCVGSRMSVADPASIRKNSLKGNKMAQKATIIEALSFGSDNSLLINGKRKFYLIEGCIDGADELKKTSAKNWVLKKQGHVIATVDPKIDYKVEVYKNVHEGYDLSKLYSRTPDYTLFADCKTAARDKAEALPNGEFGKISPVARWKSK
jgi:hypothetical protein